MNFQVGELITSQGSNGSAVVLEFSNDTKKLTVGKWYGTPWEGNDKLDGTRSGAAADVAIKGVGYPYTWFNKPANVRTINFAKNITSNISGQISSPNLWTNPEAIRLNWAPGYIVISDDFAVAPDGTQTAEKLIAYTNTNYHYTFRNYSLTAFDTWDDGVIKFDDTTNTFDEGGAASEDDNQTYTFSVFFKADEYSQVRFGLAMDSGTVGQQDIFFDLNLATGAAGTLFQPQGGITPVAYGSVPYGNGWYRAFITTTISFGFAELRALFLVYNENNSLVYLGDGSSGLYMWGAKLSKGVIDPYTSELGWPLHEMIIFQHKGKLLCSHPSQETNENFV